MDSGILLLIVIIAIFVMFTKKDAKFEKSFSKLKEEFPDAKVHFSCDDYSFKKLFPKLKEEFPDAKVHVSFDDYSFLVVDFLSDQIVVGLRIARGLLQPYRSAIPFTGIVKAEILKDGTQVTSTNRASQALGTVVGGVVLGGVGAIIGGLSGSSTSSSGTKRLSIQITVDDMSKPIHEVTFYETFRKKGGKRGDWYFDEAAQQVAEFGAYLEAAIRKSDGLKHTKIEAGETPIQEKLLVDQIGELWKLKEAGALTQDEFDAQKAKLINR